MGSRPGDRIGIIYGEVEATSYRFAASDPDVKRLDYVSAQHPAGLCLGMVVDVQRRSELSFEEAMTLGRGGPLVTGDQVSCKVKAIGYRDERGLLQTPRTPFKAGTEVRRATGQLIQKVMGLGGDPETGIYLGFLKGTDIPVVLDAETLVQKHVSVLAKTGAGKSYTVGVLIEELLKKRVPLVIVDPHGEYGTLANPNIEPKEIDNLIRFGLKPKSFAAVISEHALDTRLIHGAKKLTLDGSKLDAKEILDLLAGKVSSAQQGLLYQAINELRTSKPHYVLRDIVEHLSRNPSNAKWPLIAAVENLEATGLFSSPGTTPTDLVKPGHAAILNLKGAPPPLQEIFVARLARSLFDARKRNLCPPFLMVIEEAHNFCPERGIAHALSGAELRTIASEGRKFGMGLLIVSQRPAKVDKNVLSQCNTQIIMKVTNPNDLKAITASVEGLTGEASDEIQQLSTGVSLVAGGLLATPVLVEVRTRQTRHGGRSVSVMTDEEEDLGAAPSTPPPPIVPTADETRVDVNIEEAPQEIPAPVFGKEAEVEFEDVSPVVEPLAGGSEKHPPEIQVHPEPPRPGAAPWRQGPQRREEPLHHPREPHHAPVEVEYLERAPAAPAGPRAVRDLPEPDQEIGPNLEPEESAVHRVIERVAHLNLTSSRQAVAKVKEFARDLPTLSPEDYVRAFARIGRTFCYPSFPECGPCPLLLKCHLGTQRLANGEVREGKWGRKR